ncbi:MAG TPA: hydroxysqualene dehydroxylase HpnE [Dehalococcoidia bacterium]|nr:hydroxysqualene dehydroxylase HpnE [Dehalococcoidia bacterium]
MRVAVLGAGLAGLVCACELADRGHEVSLFEKKPWAGGKATSFADPQTGEEIDNGQHVFMGCTTAYQAFLDRLGTSHLTRLQPGMTVTVVDASGRPSRLSAARLPAPLHLLPSLLKYRHLPWQEKLSIMRAVAALYRTNSRQASLGSISFGEWLRAGQKQSERSVREFWDLIVVPTLNATCEEASAAEAMFVFQEAFLASREACAIGVPLAPLAKLHVEPALRYIEARGGGTVHLRSAIEELRIEGDRVEALAGADGIEMRFDAVVSALPPAALQTILPADWRSEEPFVFLGDFVDSPIVNVHLWFDRAVTHLDFAAVVGCDLQWFFNLSRLRDEPGPGCHLALSFSAERSLVELSKHEVLGRILPPLEAVLPRIREATLLRSQVIKEKDATFVPRPGQRRLPNTTPLRNLFLAGVHTATGWPATMESAVRSGLAAAQCLAGYQPESIETNPGRKPDEYSVAAKP